MTDLEKSLKAELADARQELADYRETAHRIYAASSRNKNRLRDINTALLEALRATLFMMDAGPQPQKLEDALTWQENNERARELAIAAIKLVREE